MILVRHGQALPQSYVSSDHPGGDAGLSELGRQQSRILGEALRERGVTPDVVVSGGLARQVETAEICLQAMGLEGTAVAQDPRWQEYDVQRVLAGYPPASPGDAPDDAAADPRGFQRILDQSLKSWMLDPQPASGLVPWPVFAAAAPEALLAEAQRATSGTTVLAFTSGGPIAAVAAHLLGLSTPESVLSLHRVVVNGSITKIIAGSRGVHLLSFNEHGHFELKGARSLTYR